MNTRKMLPAPLDSLESLGRRPSARSATRPMKSSSVPWTSSLACRAAVASGPARYRSEPARKLRPEMRAYVPATPTAECSSGSVTPAGSTATNIGVPPARIFSRSASASTSPASSASGST